MAVSAAPTIPAERLIIFMPTWLGDCVMATPTLRAIRALYPQAHIAGLIKSPMKPLMDQTPWVDRWLSVRAENKAVSTNRRRGMCATAARVRSSEFDLAILLPNSFRSALTMALAKVPRRLGYERDWRGVFLTDELKPLRQGLGFVPDPTLNYYMKIAQWLGTPEDADRTMKLFTRPSDDERAAAMLAEAGFTPGDGRLLIMLNPGANKPEKRWPPKRFAALADQLSQRFDAVIAVTGAPRERELVETVIDASSTPMVNLLNMGLNLRLLKSIVKLSGLMITNDTGPRHIAAAMNVPVVSLFGPTPPQWTTLDVPCERELYAEDGNIESIEVATVERAVYELMGRA